MELESTSWGTPRASINASIESGVRSGFELADSRALLIELQKLHRSLIRATDDLDQLTNGETPSLSRLTEARCNLSKASLSRRLLWGKIVFYLSPRLDPEAIKTLRDLQHSDIGLLHASAKHVSIWTADSIIGNWRGYRAASRIMRDRMKAGVELEREFLYPLLRSQADIGNSRREGPGAKPQA